MPNTVATIQCSNPQCQAANAHNSKQCLNCGTPILKRYLKAIEGEIANYQPNQLIANRYLVVGNGIVLDTKPGFPPATPEEVPSHISTYLKLFSYRLHLPQVYGYIPATKDKNSEPIWLLEYNGLYLDSSQLNKQLELIPKITQKWSEASDIRQLNWLWQIAQLWQPLASKQVVSSLLDGDNLCASGSIVQLLTLKWDQQPRHFTELGQLWSKWLSGSTAQVKPLLQEIITGLETGKIEQIEQLIAILEDSITKLSQSLVINYNITTATDSGRAREHNEDAAYPAPQHLYQLTAQEQPLAIVCDGIGGHAGGEVASGMAIEHLHTEIEKWAKEVKNPDISAVESKLREITAEANDNISQRNDREQRHERGRMGTTLVMTFAHQGRMYLTHVGDSRIYLISPTGCYQLTVDDDLASREVRLGYAVYREAVQYPSGGSLVQALGMSSSNSLYPTIQHIPIDEDCVFLLCSDGLSDFDRVEQYWQKKILPILQDGKKVTEVAEELIAIANEKNGHDNVTVALVHCQVKNSNQQVPVLSLPDLKTFNPTTHSSPSTLTPTAPLNNNSAKSTYVPPTQPVKPTNRWLLLTIILGGLAVATGVGAMVLLGDVGERFFPSNPKTEKKQPESISQDDLDNFKPDKTSPTATQPETQTLEAGDFIELQKEKTPIQLIDNTKETLPKGSIILIKENSSQSRSIFVEVCGVPISPSKYVPSDSAGLISKGNLQPQDYTEKSRDIIDPIIKEACPPLSKGKRNNYNNFGSASREKKGSSRSVESPSQGLEQQNQPKLQSPAL